MESWKDLHAAKAMPDGPFHETVVNDPLYLQLQEDQPRFNIGARPQHRFLNVLNHTFFDRDARLAANNT
eukprot:2561693-Lingulodinium_polyedra.AAC.1